MQAGLIGGEGFGAPARLRVGGFGGDSGAAKGFGGLVDPDEQRAGLGGGAAALPGRFGGRNFPAQLRGQRLIQLEQLRAHGFRVAVATGKPTPMACSILQRFDLERLFDCVIGCEYDGTRSTKAEVVAAALAETQTASEAALMVGDRKYDVTGAAACGVPCLGVYYGYAEPGELEAAGAAAVVQTVAELGERLLHWNEV